MEWCDQVNARITNSAENPRKLPVNNWEGRRVLNSCQLCQNSHFSAHKRLLPGSWRSVSSGCLCLWNYQLLSVLMISQGAQRAISDVYARVVLIYPLHCWSPVGSIADPWTSRSPETLGMLSIQHCLSSGKSEKPVLPSRKLRIGNDWLSSGLYFCWARP